MNKIFKALLLFSFSSPVFAGALTIEPKDVKSYVGQKVKVCGELAQIKDFKKGIYLNIDNDFPNQSITFVVWESGIPKIEKEWGSFRGLRTKTVCATEKVSSYKGSFRINLNSGYDFEVITKE